MLEEPTYRMINDLLEQASTERQPDEAPGPFAGGKRQALDSAFRHNTVERIVADLTEFSRSHANEEVRDWAARTLETLQLRSPTSLKVALSAIRKGKHMTLLEALQMEMNIATAYCVSHLLLSLPVISTQSKSRRTERW